jgi:uncharacterized membrane protein
MDDLLLFMSGWPLLRRWLGGQGPALDGTEHPSAREIVRRRYARGEIGREQFAEMQKVLDEQQAREEATRKAA